MVDFDLDHKPLPEIPFPNDLATRADPTAATGLRVNASMIAPTQLETNVRRKIDQIDGFGTMQPIAVSFDTPLDIGNLLARQRDNLDFSDDSVYVFAIDPDSPVYGEPVLMDIGRGNYPLTLQDYDQYFRADARSMATNVLFDTVEEDLNDNGVLDPGEDTDDDGVLDHPNVWPPGADPFVGLMTFYESETNTLLLKPVVPLREQTTYAVVLTDRLVGRDGQPVRSPFEYVHHLKQREQLERLGDVFDSWPGSSLSEQNVAFAWTFTTQTVSADLVAIREGLYGIGPLGWLAEEFDVDVEPYQATNPDHEDNYPPYYALPAQNLLGVLEAIGPNLLGEDMQMVEPILDSFDSVDYFFTGSFESPDFMRTDLEDGLNPENMHSENFAIDLRAGTAEYKRSKLYFIGAIPKITERNKPPFPVVIYCHSYSSMRGEAIGFAGFMAKYGIASIGIDAWGHGIPVDQVIEDIIMSAALGWGFEPFAEILLEGRARDLTGDGVMNSGGDYWTAYGFHIRDAVRQTVADHFQFVRVLRSFDGQRTWDLDQDGDGQDDLAGDFNNDGVVDLGGPDVKYFAWGQSGGGIHSGLVSPLEPHIIAAAPTVGGGGLSDVGVRTGLGNVRNASMLRSMGPLIVGDSHEGALRVEMIAPLATDDRRLVVGHIPGVQVGDRVIVENIDKGEVYEAGVRNGLKFRVSMETDAGDRFLVIAKNQAGQEIGRLEKWEEDAWYYKTEVTTELPTFYVGDDLVSPTEGFGIARCTPALRRMLSLFQMILEPADPASYAPNYFLRPLDIRPEGPTITNILEVTSLGDQDVPIHTQATLGRSAGLIPYLEEDSRYGMTPNDWLISKFVYEGLAHRGRFEGNDILFDPDDLDEGADGFDGPSPTVAQRLRLKIPTATGVSGIRFAHMTPTGMHGIFPAGDAPLFDIFTFMAYQVSHFFASEGTEILDDRCMEDGSCTMPPYYK